MSEMIQVLVADSHPLVRIGLRTVLNAQHGMTLAGEANSVYEVQHMCREYHPHVLLLDPTMPGGQARDVLSSVLEQHPEMKVLILGTNAEAERMYDLVTAGAVGYVLKNEAPETVIQAIRTVVQGGTWFSRPLLEKLVRRKMSRQDEKPSLTKGKRRLLELIAQGWENARIATELNLAEQTVRNYVSRLYMELDVRSRAEAIVWAREHSIGGTWYPSSQSL